MPIWKTTSIEETPEIQLQRWLIVELPDGDRHFVGWNATEHEGRVSSKIIEFDQATMTGRTRSGRVYQLVGESTLDLDAAYVFEAWKQINQVTEFKILEDLGTDLSVTIK